MKAMVRIDPYADPDVAIDIENVGKRFFRNFRDMRKKGGADLFMSLLRMGGNRIRTLTPGEFWALKNINLQIRKGVSLGIIGLNGSGKSTLLKLISGFYMPDEGTIRIRGKVGGLIEIGAGLHPMLTGKENIYIKGAMLGKSRREMDELYDSIVEFSELGEFINSPIKTYSSGMHIRLGFAIAINMDFEILVMDEILAVGDFTFQQKCLEKINGLKKSKTILFVSHSMPQVKLFCDQTIVLDKGRLNFIGKTEEAISFYYDRQNKVEKISESGSSSSVKHESRSCYGSLFHNCDKISDVVHCWVFQKKDEMNVLNLHDKMMLSFSFRLKKKINNLVIGVPIWLLEEERYIATFPSDFYEPKIEIDPEGKVTGSLVFECVFNPGEYVSTFNVRDGNEFLYRMPNAVFKVKKGPRVFGYVTIPHKWSFTR